VDIQTRLVDTVAYFRVAKEYPVMGRDSSGFTWVDVEANPLPIVDAWAVLSDGTIAIVRGSDYHVDYFDADGSRRSSGKLPHEWRRLSDSAKTALIDSLTKVYAANPTAFATNVNGQHVQSPGVQTATVNGVTRSHIIIPRFPDISELPDYPAPFADVKADGDGNLWILETASGTVWDVVNHAGVMIDRVQIPGGTSIEWFGPGVVYLTSRLGTTVSLVRARIR
jgi:hypothetical protein